MYLDSERVCNELILKMYLVDAAMTFNEQILNGQGFILYLCQELQIHYYSWSRHFYSRASLQKPKDCQLLQGKVSIYPHILTTAQPVSTS